MTKALRKHLEKNMTVKEMKQRISAANIKRYSHLRKHGLIEVMVANRKKLNIALPKVDKSKVRGKYVRKEVKKIESKTQQDFQRPTPTPAKSVAAQKPTGLMLI